MIRMFAVHVPDDVDGPLLKTLHSGYLTEGPRVREFEEKLSGITGAPTATVNSGTSAITLALSALGNVIRDPVVISTPMTCAATNLPVLTKGMRLVWADIDPKTGLIDPESVQKQLNRFGSKVAAVLVVDWGGAPASHEDFGVPIIEDAAHAIGATVDGYPVGSISDMTCFSFQAIKHMTTGDGGAVSSFNLRYLSRIKLLRWFGIDREASVAGDSRIDVDIEVPGYKMHMNDLSATIGLSQIEKREAPTGGKCPSPLETTLMLHRENAEHYDLNLDERLKRVQIPKGCNSSWWLYTILLPKPGMQQDFREHMRNSGVEVSQVHRRNDQYSVFKRACPEARLPGVDEFSSRMMCLPVHWDLSVEDLEVVTNAANEFVRDL